MLSLYEGGKQKGLSLELAREDVMARELIFAVVIALLYSVEVWW